MRDQPVLPLTEPPDLLRRFVPTPHEACIRGGYWRISLKTNDERLLRLAGEADEDGLEAGRAEWTMVADPEMPQELGDPLALDGDATSFLSFGRGCYVAVDHERKEITGFVSAGISDRDWRGVVRSVLELIADRWR